MPRPSPLWQPPKYHRLAWLNQRACKEKLCAKLREHFFDQVEFAHRNATGQHKQV